ncbi:MAG: helix-turn-helix domain-containing protein [Verrucomicrobiota bacterium]|nr:helix-turn-helix domain-containing protein [Verrucomicrobiota bacterium]
MEELIDSVMRKNRAATEQRLLTAARSLLEESGFAHFGINAVAERAGVDKVLVYRYFGGPNGILAALAVDPFFPTHEELLELIRPASGHNGDNSRFVTFYFQWVMHRPLLRQLFAWENAANPNPLITAFRQSRHGFEKTLAELSTTEGTATDSTTLGLQISGLIARTMAKAAEQLPITYTLERKTVQPARPPRAARIGIAVATLEEGAKAGVRGQNQEAEPVPDSYSHRETRPRVHPAQEAINSNSLPSELL